MHCIKSTATFLFYEGQSKRDLNSIDSYNLFITVKDLAYTQTDLLLPNSKYTMSFDSFEDYLDEIFKIFNSKIFTENLSVPYRCSILNNQKNDLNQPTGLTHKTVSDRITLFIIVFFLWAASRFKFEKYLVNFKFKDEKLIFSVYQDFNQFYFKEIKKCWQVKILLKTR